ncbi:Asp23/Gls24 family envelope stress response protein [Microlunatus ginsengisoli]|uniref:Asp23/Gls24 family envelope stress response protein n=1 Tax=Microlunatus ginsengisoli TaxID=363863 RepID=A0ABP7A405_9ACTN
MTVLAEPARRGRLVIADKVVEKIAGQAASEVALAGGRSGGFLGLGADTDFSARPAATVTLSGRQVAVALRLGVAYPTSIRAATEEVRRHVTRRVEGLTGLEVRRIDIAVDWLSPAERPWQSVPGRRVLL